jgi:hypothetical protein
MWEELHTCVPKFHRPINIILPNDSLTLDSFINNIEGNQVIFAAKCYLL